MGLCELLACPHPDVLLSSVLTWEQFVDWKARYEQQPWGEVRRDLRMAAEVRLLLSPYIDSHDDLPRPFFPYFDGGAEKIDFAAVDEAIAEHEQKYGRSWPRQLPSSTFSWEHPAEHSRKI